MGLIDLERRVTELCLGSGEPSADLLAQLGAAEQAKIWLLYRELIRQRLRAELAIALRRSFATAGPALERACDEWLEHAPPRSRPFCGIVAEYARFAVPRLRGAADVPAQLPDLVAFEAALWEVSDLDDRVTASVTELAFDRKPLLAPALRLLELSYAVHEREGEVMDARVAATYLCVYRRAEDKSARVLTLNAVAYALMQRIASGRDATLTESVQRVAAERRLKLDEAFLERLCTMLADFTERGVLLGSHGE